ncbi:MAG: ABC transporter ATP-binding protein [Oscillospiraceae bacterium]|jgi:ABC-2 type transport system ATP-binding protein|nr:ABC transporter ATP-binding protein [Oscillospiraceae bacterium]
MGQELVTCTALSRSFGKVKALDEVDLHLGRGKIIALAAPNGAGKTTLIKILTGLLQPTSGTALIDGQAPGVYTKKITAYMPDRPAFPEWMKVQDSIDAYHDFYEDFDSAKASDICRTLQLDGNAKIKSLSKGTKEKLQLMLVMSRKAQLYLLDEPIAGVDPAARDFILHTVVADYNENGTVLISTHLITDVEKLLDEVIFLRDGRLVLHRAADEIRETEGKTVDELFREMFRFAPWEGGKNNDR